MWASWARQWTHWAYQALSHNLPSSPRNLKWQDIIMGFCFTSALQIAHQYTKTPSQLPLSFHLLSLTVVLTFSALFVAKLISSKYPVSAQVVDEVTVFFVTTAFFLAITIPMPLCLKFLSWAIYVVLLNVFVFSFFLVQVWYGSVWWEFRAFGICITLLSNMLVCKCVCVWHDRKSFVIYICIVCCKGVL